MYFSTFLDLESVDNTAVYGRVIYLSDFIKNILICVPKMNQGLTDVEQHKGPAPFQVCPSVFMAPAHYHHRGGYRHSSTRHYNPVHHDEELLQYAIHQSLLESSALNSQDTLSDFDGQVTQSMTNRLSDGSESEGVLVDLSDTTPSSSGSTSSPDTDLRLAMELSARAQEEEERRRKEEEEELERILQLSLLEK